MLKQSDLPTPWRLRAPLDDAAGDALDDVLGLSEAEQEGDVDYHGGGKFRQPRTDRGRRRRFKSWEQIENADTGQRGYVRMQRASDEATAVVSSVIFTPPPGDERVTGKQVRELPLSAIEGNYQRRLFTSTITAHELKMGLKHPELDPHQPIGRPRDSENFYDLVAFQHIRLRLEDDNPVARMAEINAVPLSTVQRWVAEARRQGKLAPGRRGRKG